MNTDPIADMLTRIRNAAKAGHESVTMPASKIKKAIAEILVKYGFVKNSKTVASGKFEELQLALFPERNDLMLRRRSTPGQRKYVSHTALRPVRHGYGIGIISTSQGLMTTEEAMEKGIGGEFICEIS